jgi:hypothetical protein
VGKLFEGNQLEEKMNRELKDFEEPGFSPLTAVSEYIRARI